MKFLGFMMAVIASPVLAADDMSGVMAMDVRAAASIGMAKSGAGYMTLMNHTDTDVRLVGVQADFPRVEVHNVIEVDGVMKMVRQDDGIVIPAHEMVQMAPGGYHVMIMGLKAPFIAGDEFDAVLEFENLAPMTVTFKVVTRDMLEKDTHDHSAHGTHDGSN